MLYSTLVRKFPIYTRHAGDTYNTYSRPALPMLLILAPCSHSVDMLAVEISSMMVQKVVQQKLLQKVGSGGACISILSWGALGVLSVSETR